MALNNITSFATGVFNNYSNYVFGSPTVSAVMLLLLILLVALIVRIPLSIALSLLVPLTLVLMALAWLPVVAGSIIIVILFVLAGVTIATSLF